MLFLSRDDFNLQQPTQYTHQSENKLEEIVLNFNRTEIVIKKLEEHLEQAPSKSAWGQIVDTLLHLELAPAEMEWVPLVEASLASWPSELRVATLALKKSIKCSPFSKRLAKFRCSLRMNEVLPTLPSPTTEIRRCPLSSKVCNCRG